MYVLHTFLLTICLVANHVCVGYEVINNEIIERIDLDNGRDLQQLAHPAGPVKISPRSSHQVERVKSGDDFNSVQSSPEGLGTSDQRPSIIYAAIQAMPHIIANNNGQSEVESDKARVKSITILQGSTETSQDIDAEKPNSKFEDPKEDKSKDVKAKLYSHIKQTLPKLYSMLNVEMNKHVTEEEGKPTGEKESSLKIMNVQPYATIIDDEKDLKMEQSEENPYVVYDKQDFLKPTVVKKTVKTHKIGDEKKNVYPKEEIKSVSKDKDDMETDNTIWIGYGYGVPAYKYPYNNPSSLYANYYTYGRPYSGWTRGYTGSPYYGGYVDRRTSLDSGYYNNYGAGYGPYGGYL